MLSWSWPARGPLNWVDKSNMATWFIPGNQMRKFHKCLTRNANDNYVFSLSCVRHLTQIMISVWHFLWMKSILFGIDNEISPGLFNMELKGPCQHQQCILDLAATQCWMLLGLSVDSSMQVGETGGHFYDNLREIVSTSRQLIELSNGTTPT